MHKMKLAVRLGAGMSAFLLAACGSTTPNWDARFGESVRTMNAQQVARPQTAANTNPVEGIDGRAAKAAMDRYEKAPNDPKTAASPLANSGSK